MVPHAVDAWRCGYRSDYAASLTMRRDAEEVSCGASDGQGKTAAAIGDGQVAVSRAHAARRRHREPRGHRDPDPRPGERGPGTLCGMPGLRRRRPGGDGREPPRPAERGTRLAARPVPGPVRPGRG